MNMQAMLKQAQKLQKDMSKAQEEINSMIFIGKSSNVEIKIDGKGMINDVKINLDGIENDDIELLQDMIMIAFNDAKKKLDETTESKMGVFTNGMPGIF